MEVDKAYQDLTGKIDAIAQKTEGPERHVVEALGNQIKALGELDNQIEALNRSVNNLNKTTSGLMRRQIWLIVIQTVLAVIIGWAAIRISK